jgi:hypothetical protein
MLCTDEALIYFFSCKNGHTIYIKYFRLILTLVSWKAKHDCRKCITSVIKGSSWWMYSLGITKRNDAIGRLSRVWGCVGGKHVALMEICWRKLFESVSLEGRDRDRSTVNVLIYLTALCVTSKQYWTQWRDWIDPKSYCHIHYNAI